jgi:hypothetical protein
MRNCTGFEAHTNRMRCMADGFRCIGREADKRIRASIHGAGDDSLRRWDVTPNFDMIQER